VRIDVDEDDVDDENHFVVVLLDFLVKIDYLIQLEDNFGQVNLDEMVLLVAVK